MKGRARCTERVLAEVIYFTNVEHYNREKGTVYSEKAPVYEYRATRAFFADAQAVLAARGERRIL